MAQMDSSHYSQRIVSLVMFPGCFSVSVFKKGVSHGSCSAPSQELDPYQLSALKVSERTSAQKSSCRCHVFAQELSDAAWRCLLLARGLM